MLLGSKLGTYFASHLEYFPADSVLTGYHVLSDEIAIVPTLNIIEH